MSAPNGVLAIVGATATGKSALAVEVALRLGGEVISADAFTAYACASARTRAFSASVVTSCRRASSKAI